MWAESQLLCGGPRRAARREQNTGTCTEATHRFGAVLVHQVHFSAIGDPGCVEDFVDLDKI